VLLIDADSNQLGEVPLARALAIAEEAGFDLVEVSPHSNPPVCRVMDYGKYQYQQKKKHTSKPKSIKLKEIKLRPVTEEGDYQVKLRNLVRFIEQGDKVKVTIRFRGREITHQELAIRVFDRLKSDVKDIAVIEQTPKLEGRQMVMVLSAVKKN